MKTLVWVEHDNASVKDATLAAVTAASQLGEVHLLVAGSSCAGVAAEAAKIAGVGKVHLADDAAYANALAENVAPLVAGLMASHDAFVAPATTTGKNIAPRVAALLDVMQISDILSVEGPKTFTRPIYAGNAIATVESSDAKLVITVRGTAFAKAETSGGSGSVEAVSGAGDAGTSSFMGSEIAKSERPELTSAKVIVSGGRALKDADTFKATIFPLADKLGAAVGASRAAVVRRMAKQLADRHSRQRKRAMRGKLDIRRTVRRSLAHEGIPFELIWRTEKVDRPSIVCLCDVSRSVAAAAQFLLTFLYSLNEVVHDLRSFAFAGRLIEVDSLLAQLPVEEAIGQVLREIGFQQTDYGKSLEDFADKHLTCLDRHTTVIVLGDARSNYAGARLDIFAEIAKRSRAVIWLNPEPETYWGSGDSEMRRYERFCHIAQTCNTLAELEHIIEHVLRICLPR